MYITTKVPICTFTNLMQNDTLVELEMKTISFWGTCWDTYVL